MAEGCNNLKKIRVRKASSTSVTTEQSRQDYEDYYIPLAAQDSQWKGINLKTFAENTEHIQGTSDEEIEVRVINLEQEGTSPLLLLFPDLRKEDSQTRLLNGQMSTSSLTKLLKGRKAKLELLKPSRKLYCKQSNLNPVQEDSESGEDITNDGIHGIEITYSTSNDGDISSESIENVIKKKVPNNKILTKAERDFIYKQRRSKRVGSKNMEE